MRPTNPHVVVFCFCILACAGCTAVKPRTLRIAPTSSASGLRSASIVYRVYSSSHSATAPIAHHSANPLPPDRVRIVSIKFPHPDQRAGYALAESIIADLRAAPSSNQPAWIARLGNFAREALSGISMGSGIQESKAVDIPVAKIEAIAVRLAAQGYFQPSRVDGTNVELACEINGHGQNKPWMPVAELDQLLSHVRSQGAIVGFPLAADSLMPRHRCHYDFSHCPQHALGASSWPWPTPRIDRTAYQPRQYLRRIPPVE
jgi:hypothetical protein